MILAQTAQEKARTPRADAPPCLRVDILLKRAREVRGQVINLQSDTDMLARVRLLHARVVALDEATRDRRDIKPDNTDTAPEI